MELMGKKIPKYVIGLIVIVLLLLAFVPLVLMPYLTEKPKLDAQHTQAQTTLRLYDTKLNNIDNYRGTVNDLKLRWSELETKMFVDAADTANDLNKMFMDLGVTPGTISVSDESQAVEPGQSSTGDPLYSTSITLSFTTSKEKLLQVVNFFESKSAGSYYISTVSLSTVTQTAAAGGTVMRAGDLSVNMGISLYYFKEGAAAPTEAQQ